MWLLVEVIIGGGPVQSFTADLSVILVFLATLIAGLIKGRRKTAWSKKQHTSFSICVREEERQCVCYLLYQLSLALSCNGRAIAGECSYFITPREPRE